MRKLQSFVLILFFLPLFLRDNGAEINTPNNYFYFIVVDMNGVNYLNCFNTIKIRQGIEKLPILLFLIKLVAGNTPSQKCKIIKK